MTMNERDIRTAYIETLQKLGAENPNLVVLDSDLAASTGSKQFADVYPDRFFDCGIQEANMIGVAAGMSAMGMVPIVHSFAAFAGRRVVDQVFMSCAYAGLNVRIVGVDPGLCAGKNGGTHMSLEDMGIMRTIPGVTVLDPSDEISLAKLLRQSVETPGVYYLRLNRKATVRLYESDADIRIGKANQLCPGSDVTLIAAGTLCVPEAVRASDALKARGISARVLDMATIKPLDVQAVQCAARETRAIITIENHNVIGALGSAVSEVLAESGTVPFARIGVQDVFGQVGSIAELQAFYGITAQAIEQKALALLNRN
ncbi:MAG: transketolase C-terminal domain-containing protein [Clostridia bacterium]